MRLNSISTELYLHEDANYEFVVAWFMERVNYTLANVILYETRMYHILFCMVP